MNPSYKKINEYVLLLGGDSVENKFIWSVYCYLPKTFLMISVVFIQEPIIIPSSIVSKQSNLGKIQDLKMRQFLDDIKANVLADFKF